MKTAKSVQVVTKILVTGRELTTDGLRARAGSEITVSVNADHLIDAAKSFLNWVESATATRHDLLVPGGVLQYGYWQVHLKERASHHLEGWGNNDDYTLLEPGISRALTHWTRQTELCTRIRAPFSPVSFELLAGVSLGVLECEWPVYGSRYQPSTNVTGWFFWTDRYAGEDRKLTPEHSYHVTAARPRLAEYLALPVGYNFKLGEQTEDVWFDEEQARQPI